MPKTKRHQRVTKRCIECHRVLPIDRFWIHNKSADGRSHRCGNCLRSRVGFVNGQPRKTRKPSEVKYCPRCKRTLAVAMFDVGRFNSGGRQSYCKECFYKPKPGETQRRCPRCSKTFPLTSEFFHNCGTGFQTCCRPCNTEQARVAKFRDKFGIT